MEQQEITKCNKLIAEFMGAIWQKDDYGADGYVYLESKPPTGIGSGYTIDALKYHSSWDWLIPAWSKLFNPIQEKYFEYGDSSLRKWLMINRESYCNAVNNNDVKKAFNIVSKGIKWYNQQSK